HVAVLAVGRPASDELGEDRRATGERTLQRILEIEQAEVILAALADHDPPRALVRIGEQLWPFPVKLALQRLGESRDPHGPTRLLGPKRCRREVSQRLADA